MMSFVNTAKSKYRVVAGPGAGVTMEIECDVSWETKGDKIVFAPTNADVTWHSYYNTKSSKEYGSNSGLKIELDELTGDDKQEFWNRFGYNTLNDDAGTIHLTKKTKIVKPDSQYASELVLSGGWVRAQYKAGESFSFGVELDSEYGVILKGTATFLDNGAYAWQDLDEPDSEDEE
jgi:hypothetical protein